MPEQTDHIHLRSEEVQDILGKTPSWMIRWGTAMILGLILMLVFLSWFIRYPDVIAGPVMVTTETPPVKLVSNSSGKLIRLFHRDGTIVKEGEPLAEIENNMTREGMMFLDSLLPDVDRLLASKTDWVAFNDHDLVFGSLQQDYQSLKTACTEYAQWRNDPYGVEQIGKLKNKITHYRQLIAIMKDQAALSEKELRNATETYHANQKLYKEGVYSKKDFFDRESAYRQKQQTVEEQKKAMTQNAIALNDLESQLLDAEHARTETERKYREDIRRGLASLRNGIQSWEQNFLLRSPISGKLSYLSNLSTSQHVNSGDALFAVIPESESYTAWMELPSQGAGKVRSGQQVQIAFQDYPSHEYGRIAGQVVSLSLIPNGNTYRAEIRLTDGLESTYHRKLAYKPEMKGTAEVVTDDLRLMDRVFNRFREVLKR
ncbi:MAG: HlyD family efflux transporter periplasmic adaptor subunit [Flavobacteriales bacterium]|nr:HlyD family efflux transporter periplasmic adaptor subunit [Flavobacteriales bacterium]MCB9448541.1 HlyD family efflux transporter periplasmic adaptor subunit [Flavobacteriales bacterium]